MSASDQSRGWVKVYRKLLDHPRYRDSGFVHVWLHLLLNATHAPMRRVFAGKEIMLEPGQLITGRIAISAATGVHQSKIYRVLEQLKTDQQIEQRTSNACSLITITKWSAYQETEQPIEQQTNNQRTTSEHSQEHKKYKGEPSAGKNAPSDAEAPFATPGLKALWQEELHE